MRFLRVFDGISSHMRRKLPSMSRLRGLSGTFRFYDSNVSGAIDTAAYFLRKLLSVKWLDNNMTLSNKLHVAVNNVPEGAKN